MTVSYKFITSLWIMLNLVLAGHGTCAIAASPTQPDMAEGVLVPMVPIVGDIVRTDSPPVQQVEVIRLRAGLPPEVTLSGDTMFRILAAEFAAQRGVYDVAGSLLLELARNIPDPRLARRALEFYLTGGHLQDGLAAARYWLRLAPDDMEADATVLALTAATGQTQGLATELRQRIDAASDKAEAIAQAVSVLGRLQVRRQALDILDQALSPEVRKLVPARLALSDVAQALGDDERAIFEARMALAAQPDSEDAAQRLLDYGMNVDSDHALAEARAFVKRYPGARRVRLILAGVLADRGRYDEALAELQAMSRRTPEDFDLLYMQAQVNYQARRLDTAQNLLQQYVDVQSQRRNATLPETTDAGIALTDAYMLLARIAECQGRIDDAIITLGRVDDPAMLHTVRLRQAALLASQQRVEEALATARSASPQDDDEAVSGVLAVAQILRDAGRLDEAIAELKVADADYPDAVEVKYDLAMLYERQSKFADFERLMREVMTLAPEHAHARNALGYTLADRNTRLPEAQALIQRAHELLPDDPYIMDSLGWVYFRLGRNDLALRYLQQAYNARPDAEIAAHLGEVLWSQDRRDEALQRWREGVRTDEGNPTLRETLHRLGIEP